MRKVATLSSTNSTSHHHPPAEGTLRLVGLPSTTKEGKLQIFHDGVWGNICDDNWDMRDANVACRQLNFGEAEAPLLRNYDDSYAYAGSTSWEAYNAWLERDLSLIHI